MANSAPWAPAWSQGLRSWACLLECDGQWAGARWFCVGGSANDRLVLPRLIETELPGEEFCRLLVELIARGADVEAILLDAPITGPEQLRAERVADLKQRLDHAGPPFEVPIETFLRVVDGRRDHGGVPDVDTRIAHWVGLQARHVLVGDSIEALAAGEPIDESHARKNLAEARRRVAAHGVLPFALWAGGRLPRGWRDSPVMTAGLDRWREEAAIVNAKRRLIAIARHEHRRTQAALEAALAAVHNDDADRETAEAIFWTAATRRATGL
ncbi:MAG TPA: hypothetical protein VMY78_13360 [Solirubrobacteraceae bacterium]|nr:hypothetical protein [Solirubrobacteraceae bacterium]